MFSKVSLQRSFRSAESDTTAIGGELDTTESEVYGAMLRTPCSDDVAMSANGRGLARFVNHAERAAWVSASRLNLFTSDSPSTFC